MPRYTVTLDIETWCVLPIWLLRCAMCALTSPANGWPKVLHMTVVRSDREGLV